MEKMDLHCLVPYSMKPLWRVGWDIDSVEGGTLREILETAFGRTEEHTWILSTCVGLKTTFNFTFKQA